MSIVIDVEPVVLDRVIRTACQRAIDREPDLTRWDMIMGDGDCGESVKAVCQCMSLIFNHVTMAPILS